MYLTLSLHFSALVHVLQFSLAADFYTATGGGNSGQRIVNVAIDGWVEILQGGYRGRELNFKLAKFFGFRQKYSSIL